jgi:protein-S-isoprenylcysteine O-methyltransferase Ste14
VRLLPLTGPALNAGLLLAPVVAIAGERAVDGPALLFVAGSALLCAADLTRQAPEEPAEAIDSASGHAALATGLLLLACSWAGLIEHALQPAALPAMVRVTGASAMLLGAWLRAASIRQLGPAFVSGLRADPEQGFARDGIFAVLRHPSEAGLLAAALGGALVLGSRTALGVWAGLLLPLVLWRVRREDAFLISRYGPAYRSYARATGALLPRQATRSRTS